MANRSGNRSPSISDDSSSDDSFVFQDVLDLQNVENRVCGDYNRSWGIYAIESIPWEEKKCPYANILNKAELKLNEREQKGILSIRMIAACASYLSKSPITQEYVLCKCNLSRSGLKCIDILKYYHHFEYIDLSYNNLTSVSDLKNAAMLMYLDVSHNMLELLLEFRPPLNLTFVNYSHNCITKIKDLEQYWSIIKLDLSHNDIVTIEGIDNLQYLQDLNISYNNIKSINNIGNLQNLITLNLSHNGIVEIECSLKNLRHLKYVDFSHNKIKKLEMFRYNSLKLTKIVIQQNRISNLLQLTHLQNLSNLLELDIRGNTIISHALFWNVAVNALRCIKVLNGTTVNPNQKLYVSNYFNPTVNISLSKKKNMLQLINNLRTSRMICKCLLPANMPTPPFIILVGPLGCRKNEIAISFAKHKENVKLFVNHTTRPKMQNEVEGLHYYFVTQTQFEAQFKAGEFMTVLEIFGHMFGLHTTELEKINTYSSNCIYITHADLISALIIRDHGYMPTILLTIPKSEEVHREWLLKKYIHEHVYSYYSYLFEKQTYNVLPGIAIDLASTLDKIVHSISIVDEFIERAYMDVEGTEDRISELSFSKETGEEVEEKSISIESPAVVDISEDVMQNVEKSCLRKNEYPREIISTMNASGIRPTVTFGETEESFLSDYDVDNENVNLLMLGYDSEETFVLNSMREVQDTLKIPEEVQIRKERQETDQAKQELLKEGQPREDSKVKSSITQHPRRTFMRGTIESEVFVDSVIKTRNFYIDYHHDNSGIFSDVICVDAPEEEIMGKLNEIADSIIQPKAINDVCSYLGLEDSTRMINEKRKELLRAVVSTQSIAVSQQLYVDNYVRIQTNTQRFSED